LEWPLWLEIFSLERFLLLETFFSFLKIILFEGVTKCPQEILTARPLKLEEKR